MLGVGEGETEGGVAVWRRSDSVAKYNTVVRSSSIYVVRYVMDCVASSN